MNHAVQVRILSPELSHGRVVTVACWSPKPCGGGSNPPDHALPLSASDITYGACVVTVACELVSLTERVRFPSCTLGEVAEWTKAPVSKAGVWSQQPAGGSNPTLSVYTFIAQRESVRSASGRCGFDSRRYPLLTAGSSAEEHVPDKDGVPGSIPGRPISTKPLSSSGPGYLASNQGTWVRIPPEALCAWCNW